MYTGALKTGSTWSLAAGLLGFLSSRVGSLWISRDLHGTSPRMLQWMVDMGCLETVIVSLMCSFSCSKAVFVVQQGTCSCWARLQPLGIVIAMKGQLFFLTMFQRVACETVTSLCTFSGCFPYCINLTIAIQHKPQRTCNLCFNSKRIALRWFCTVGQRFLLLASIKFLL